MNGWESGVEWGAWVRGWGIKNRQQTRVSKFYEYDMLCRCKHGCLRSVCMALRYLYHFTALVSNGYLRIMIFMFIRHKTP